MHEGDEFEGFYLLLQCDDEDLECIYAKQSARISSKKAGLPSRLNDYVVEGRGNMVYTDMSVMKI